MLREKSCGGPVSLTMRRATGLCHDVPALWPMVLLNTHHLPCDPIGWASAAFTLWAAPLWPATEWPPLAAGNTSHPRCIRVGRPLQHRMNLPPVSWARQHQQGEASWDSARWSFTATR